MLVPPRVTFDEVLSVDLGGLTLELHALPGHTPDCIVAFVPECGLWLGGDTVETPLPVVPADAPLDAWIGALERWSGDDRVRAVVPAHGDIGDRRHHRAEPGVPAIDSGRTSDGSRAGPDALLSRDARAERPLDGEAVDRSRAGPAPSTPPGRTALTSDGRSGGDPRQRPIPDSPRPARRARSARPNGASRSRATLRAIPSTDARPAASAEACCQQCARALPWRPYYDQCLYFVYDEKARRCSLKRNEAGRVKAAGTTSGRVVAWPTEADAPR